MRWSCPGGWEGRVVGGPSWVGAVGGPSLGLGTVVVGRVVGSPREATPGEQPNHRSAPLPSAYACRGRPRACLRAPAFDVLAPASRPGALPHAVPAPVVVHCPESERARARGCERACVRARGRGPGSGALSPRLSRLRRLLGRRPELTVRHSSPARQPRPLPGAQRCRQCRRGTGCGAWRSSSPTSATVSECGAGPGLRGSGCGRGGPGADVEGGGPGVD